MVDKNFGDVMKWLPQLSFKKKESDSIEHQRKVAELELLQEKVKQEKAKTRSAWVETIRDEVLLVVSVSGSAYGLVRKFSKKNQQLPQTNVFDLSSSEVKRQEKKRGEHKEEFVLHQQSSTQIALPPIAFEDTTGFNTALWIFVALAALSLFNTIKKYVAKFFKIRRNEL